MLLSSRGATTSEDCLTLNVWTPTRRPRQPMPVMVWIHGGGNDSGTSAPPVFLYRFEYVASFLGGRRTAANHGSEIPFVFATWPDYRLNAADQHMTHTLHGCWVAFAKTGMPACPEAPQWPSFSVGSDIWMRFGADIAPAPVSDRAVLNFLQQALQK